MIRRKLTRLEVTLDDTKEVDDLFSKPVQIGLAAAISSSSATATTTITAPNTASSKLASHYYQKQLLLLGRQYEQAQNTEASTSLEPTTANSGAASSNLDSTVPATSAIVDLSTETPLTYNPQPYNPTNRFQLNQESQQLR